MRPWTEEEVEVLRRPLPVAEVARLLGRSVAAVNKKRQALGLRKTRPWTRADDRALEELWEGNLGIDKIAETLGRTPRTIYQRARMRGLGVGVRPGMVALSVMAARCGYSSPFLIRIMHWAGRNVTTTRSLPDRFRSTRRNPQWRFRQLDEIETLEAVERWTREMETLEAAARRHGTKGETLREWLEQAGIKRPPIPRRHYWWVCSADVDRVVEARRQQATAEEAGAALGVNSRTLAVWARALGMRPCGRVWRFTPADLERLRERSRQAPTLRGAKLVQTPSAGTRGR